LAAGASASWKIANRFDLHLLDFESFTCGGADCRPDWIAFLVGCEPRVSGEGGLSSRFSGGETAVGLRVSLEVHPKKFNRLVESVSDSEVDSGFILCFGGFDSDRTSVVIGGTQRDPGEFFEFFEARRTKDFLIGRIDPNPLLRPIGEGFRVPETLVCDPFRPDTVKEWRGGVLSGND